MALFTQQMTSGLSNANYAQINDLIGQMKTFVLQSANVTLISDNNPVATVQREVRFTVGTSTHKMSFKANGYTQVAVDITNAANTALIINPTFSQSYCYNSFAPLNQNLRMLTGANIFFLWSPNAATDYCVFPCYIKNSDGTWNFLWWRPGYGWDIYVDGSDANGGGVSLSVTYATYGGYDTTGAYFPLPLKYMIGSQIQAYTPLAIFSVYTGGLTERSFYTDPSGNTWFYIRGYFYTDKP